MRSISQKKVILALCMSMSLLQTWVFAEGEWEEGSYVDILPSCEEQWLYEDYTIPNPNSFVEPSSEYLNAFTWDYCQIANEIDWEALEYLDEISKNKEKNSLDLIREVGEDFCRDGFGPCGTEEETFFSRYVAACDEGRKATKERIDPSFQYLAVDDPFLEVDCTQLARDKVEWYKKMAFQEISTNQTKNLEAANLETMKKNREETDKMDDVKENLYAKFGKIIRSIQGFLQQVWPSFEFNSERSGLA